MRDMGDATADVWAAELRRTGRVVFPLRRRWTLLLVPLQILPPLLILGLLLRAAPPPGVVDVLVVAAVYAVLIGIRLYQLIVQRPAVVVDRDGIRYGRRKFLPWSAIGGLGVVIGPPLGRSFLVIRRDLTSKNVRLYQQNIRDLPEFRRWLGALLMERQGSGQA
ncbi:hypothetical protein ACQHIV_39310 [Kribbella sp. GL6]|uniref:hypothetical protein n=1 Tax=Kribbella sp. GL6 TaxID=3419765 RepID=UPI003CFEDF94